MQKNYAIGQMFIVAIGQNIIEPSGHTGIEISHYGTIGEGVWTIRGGQNIPGNEVEIVSKTTFWRAANFIPKV